MAPKRRTFLSTAVRRSASFLTYKLHKAPRGFFNAFFLSSLMALAAGFSGRKVFFHHDNPRAHHRLESFQLECDFIRLVSSDAARNMKRVCSPQTISTRPAMHDFADFCLGRRFNFYSSFISRHKNHSLKWKTAIKRRKLKEAAHRERKVRTAQ